MKCPKCRNKGFMPSEDVPRPLTNIGGKLHNATFDTRRYVCMQCGYRFMTKEEFYREVNAAVQNEMFHVD